MFFSRPGCQMCHYHWSIVASGLSQAVRSGIDVFHAHLGVHICPSVCAPLDVKSQVLGPCRAGHPQSKPMKHDIHASRILISEQIIKTIQFTRKCLTGLPWSEAVGPSVFVSLHTQYWLLINGLVHCHLRKMRHEKVVGSCSPSLFPLWILVYIFLYFLYYVINHKNTHCIGC